MIKISESIAQALADRKAVVALESTVIAHGLPYPLNLEVAAECERLVHDAGAIAATIGIVDGTPTVGLSQTQLQSFAQGQAPDGSPIEKVGWNNLASVMMKRQWGATTVAGTLRIARLAGIKVFATGGIGGVHRGAADTFDISADLTALAEIPMVCVCAGAKAILDLAKTLERLETVGVPVVGFQSPTFPAFYSRSSGLPVDSVAQTADEAAQLALHHWAAGSTSALLVCAPVPEAFEIAYEEIERATAEAMRLAEIAGIRGKAVTPFLLSRMKEITAGKSLETNRALLLNNAAIAAQIAVSLVRLR
ncbi:MAG: pseudouridine-5'-phosphate glycosidase [Acidobacteria bacterium]|nr:pseudouridine-5'-phosphate glycosidase [Acidobacteriota bacterium]